MCGIAGIFDPDRTRPVLASELEAMTGRLGHRGPDDGAIHVADGIGFGFTRLAIVDLAGGNQPHASEDGAVVSVCNGEIYNHRTLRRDLDGRGHRFRSRCDVEVLVHLYEEAGVDGVRQLNGQFAFALFDSVRHRLVLGRDPAGIAPLFYTRVGERLLFASEIKALLTHPGVTRRVDLTGLDQVLTFPGPVSPTTLFAGIQALPPGHVLVAEGGDLHLEAYWDLDYPPRDGGPVRCRDGAYVDALDQALSAAVARRLEADVPVGLYLSGGLDSSLIAALARKAVPGRELHSFSIVFPQGDIDERHAQEAMAARLGTCHHAIEFTPDHIIDGLRRAVVAAEAPLKESYNTCSLALSALVRETGHKVVLTGEGADELFAGYVGYRLDAAGTGRPLPDDPLEAVLEAETRQALWGDPDFFYERDYCRFREIRAGLYAPALAARLGDFDCTARSPVDRRRLAGRHPLHQRSYADFKLRLADHLLADHGDRVAYANSVEARYPFLDPDVMAVAATLPPDLLVRDGQEKWLLRQVARRHLPETIAGREKFAFVAPGSPFLVRRRVDWIDDLLSPARIRRQGYFNAEVVAALRDRHLAGETRVDTTFDTDVLMLVLCFGLFLDAFALPDLAA